MPAPAPVEAPLNSISDDLSHCKGLSCDSGHYWDYTPQLLVPQTFEALQLSKSAYRQGHISATGQSALYILGMTLSSMLSSDLY
ncbi:hypothetical protein AZE42_09023 [Rhizopogon vesiculosus]|uniref:Uncharacterized protein n=1 Tax=Rhizopogon vesiculosus TaxID=180088 RepID=A0A1J8Q5R3_9AGAM|nr:hypothetical protein AZE42_09023 [Rhizopogon vesiculosus]